MSKASEGNAGRRRRGAASRKESGSTAPARLTAGLVFGAVLMILGWSMVGTNYREPQRTLDQGTAGTFTLRSCEHYGGGSSSGGGTSCVGTFRSDDGEVVLKGAELSEKNDASGLDRGASFPARARVTGDRAEDLYRADDVGRNNILQKGIGSAGIGFIGLMVAGLGVLALWTSTGLPRRVVRGALLIGILAGVVMWIGGLTAGGGVWV